MGRGEFVGVHNQLWQKNHGLGKVKTGSEIGTSATGHSELAGLFGLPRGPEL